MADYGTIIADGLYWMQFFCSIGIIDIYLEMHCESIIFLYLNEIQSGFYWMGFMWETQESIKFEWNSIVNQ